MVNREVREEVAIEPEEEVAIEGEWVHVPEEDTIERALYAYKQVVADHEFEYHNEDVSVANEVSISSLFYTLFYDCIIL